MKKRARNLGVPFEGETGIFNAITDVEGVEVGHSTLIEGEGRLAVGEGPIRTGVTAVLPRGKNNDPVFAGWYALNGNGEMTGTTWVEESGFLEGPVMLTNTHSVGRVHHGVIDWMVQERLANPEKSDVFWSLPVVAETYDGILNDINGFHVTEQHVFDALDSAASGPVAEGNVGGGTGMICHGFKGGVGTASRKLEQGNGSYTVGVLVQANYGARKNLMVGGVPIGREISGYEEQINTKSAGLSGSSIIVVVATDAPLLPHQLKRLAKRVPIGIGRVGGMGANSSGDIFITFSTANPQIQTGEGVSQLQMLANDAMTPLFEATVFATEEAIINALIAAETMTGINGNTVHALPQDQLVGLLKKHNRVTGDNGT